MPVLFWACWSYWRHLIGTIFFKNGYNLGRSQSTYASVGWLMPLAVFGLLLLMFIFPQVPEQGQQRHYIL
jgi:hypothetical protein